MVSKNTPSYTGSVFWISGKKEGDLLHRIRKTTYLLTEDFPGRTGVGKIQPAANSISQQPLGWQLILAATIRPSPATWAPWSICPTPTTRGEICIGRAHGWASGMGPWLGVTWVGGSGETTGTWGGDSMGPRLGSGCNLLSARHCDKRRFCGRGVHGTDHSSALALTPVLEGLQGRDSIGPW